MKRTEESALRTRQELLAAKNELIKIMREVINPINIIACRLESEASSLLPAAADEQLHNETKPRGKKAKVEEPLVAMPNAVPLPKGKRACSKCRRPGHRATNCPN